MQPPFHFTGDPNVDWVIAAIGVLFCLYWLRALRLAREGARAFLRNLALAVLVWIAGQFVITRMNLQDPKGANLLCIFVALAVFYRKGGKRSRYIPVAERRAVTEKHEGYDPKKHHVHHVWPFARGGSNTKDNLRVLDKQKNLKKGKKRPKMWEMW